MGHGQQGGHHHAVHVIHAWETSNSLEADMQLMEDVLLCANWQVVYTNSGLHHWFCQWDGHMGLSLTSELDRTIHLHNLKLCTNGDSQDVRTGSVHLVWVWCVMCCWWLGAYLIMLSWSNARVWVATVSGEPCLNRAWASSVTLCILCCLETVPKIHGVAWHFCQYQCQSYNLGFSTCLNQCLKGAWWSCMLLLLQ